MTGIRWLRGLIASLVLAAPGVAIADEAVAAVDPGAAAPAADSDARPVAEAARRTGPIDIDGRLEEAAWQAAPTRTGFWQRNPNEGAPPEHQTEFRVLYDDEALYIGLRLHDDRPEAIQGLLHRRDLGSPSDWVFVAIDSYFDRRTAFIFGINAAGVQLDALAFDDVKEDIGWDAVWTGKARVDDRGWTAELRIPLGQLRFSGDPSQTWGLQIRRVVARSNEETMWAPWPQESARMVGDFGTLQGIEGIAPARRLEILPYLVGGAGLRDALEGDPFNDDLDGKLGAGADLRYGLTNDLTLSVTVNPDFGQVEADPSQVNLGAQELFFPERRPFFLEGTDIFRFGIGVGDDATEQLFYTRRIGAAPHGAARGDFTDVDALTTIYGAAKVSGKTRSGWSIGILDAVTAEERAQVAIGDQRSEPVIEPLTNFGIVRVRKDLRGGASHVGGAFTSVERALGGTGLEWLHDRAYAGGLDGSHRFGGGAWIAEARLSGSYVAGSMEAIDRTQRAPQRYYQRPDADHLDYDPTRTSLTGAALTASVMKMGGKHWRYGGGLNTRTPGFEVNDLGFQQAADSYIQWLWGQYRDTDPGDVVREYSINSNLFAVSDWNPRVLGAGGNVNLSATHVSYWGGNIGAAYDGNRWDPNLLRGGPMVRADETMSAWAGIWTDARKDVRGSLDLSGGLRPAADSRSLSINPGVTWQAASNVDLYLGGGAFWNDGGLQYVTRAVDGAARDRHVLSRIKQRTLSATLRANVTFSTRLSLQAYVQPFLFTGNYSQFYEPVAPRARDFGDRFHVFEPDRISRSGDTYLVDADGDGATDFSFADPDLRFRQLRSNLVLRWEYRPGSTLFFIWSHDRTSVGPGGRFDLGGDLDRLAGEQGEHLVLAKLNYWMGF